ncbi:hypothetical protein GCK72_017826 [Caenorhabditis remanei]|uniref:Ground-like domain-containing protein n=1 Tax=Caenorhabditis remanei TaxID=31234 RepID=A0A6A5G9N9_CAERE|nr:hypothetical protein GCK72_017826 [Caenorhabditis remanei]KAF1751272.1 hypothetical protein GCK72_017826 [Caenorhabditis remanei]
MWEFILMQEPKRVKRGAPHQNGTLHAAHSGGRTSSQVLPIPPRWSPNPPPPNSPIRHQTLIQPVDSNAPVPLPPPQRHIVERQVVPFGRPPPIYNLNPYSAQLNPVQNYIRPNLPSPVQYRNGAPNQSQPQGYQPQNAQQHQPAPPHPYPQQRPISNYNQPQRSPYPRPQPYQQQVSPPKQALENNNYSSDRNGGNYQNPTNSGSSRGNKKKDKKKKGRKNKSSKMCKLCREMSEEEDSEEKEVACDMCKKSSRNGKKKGKSQTGRINGKVGGNRKNKIDSDEHPEGEGAQVEDITGDGDDDYYSDGETTDQTPTTASQPTIIDFAKRAEQNKLMRIPVYRGKKLENKTDSYNTGSGEYAEGDGSEEEEKSEFSTNIREAEKPTKYSDKPNVKYSYPPKDTLPLQTCFHNPSGYVCCNLELNNVVESTYKEIRELPDFNPCNLQVIANKVQRASEKMFQHPFETLVAHADFAQNINFAGDLVCKLEIDGKYMISYGTPYHADEALGPQGPNGEPLPVRTLKL